jgi:hypothetical protein
MKYMDVGCLGMLLAHRSLGDVIRNKGEQSALQAPPHGRPQQDSLRSACTATPHSGPPQGGVQSARGQLPGAKIGAKDTIAIRRQRVIQAQGPLDHPPARQNLEGVQARGTRSLAGFP